MALSLIKKLTGMTWTTKRRDTRVPAPGVEVSYLLGLEQRPARIKNISPTGVYLQTPDDWPTGSTVLLTMKSRNHLQKCSEAQVRIPARIVRHDHDGVGMEFVIENISTAEWLDLFSKAASLTLKNDTVQVFRIAKALAFLLRIAPFAQPQILSAISKAMSQERAERAIDMILNAESLLASQEVTPRTDVSPPLIRRILEEGSRSQDQLMQRYWTGMLASTCLDCLDSNASAAFITLLSELAPIHIRILDAAGLRSIEAGWEPGLILSETFYCTMNEIRVVTGVKVLTEIDTALDYLDSLGLLEMTVKGIAHKHVNLTPTLLGLKFYARCRGQVGQSIRVGPVELHTAS